jgi:predicted ribosomally synthesized peptide with nif11-like leader
MSVASVNQFYQVAMQDPDLKQQFHTASASKSDQDILQMAVEQGQKHGYSFTTEEVAQAIAATQLPAETDGNVELSDLQLEAVAGGGSKTNAGIDAGRMAGQAVVGTISAGVNTAVDTVGAGVGAVGGFFTGLFS